MKKSLLSIILLAAFSCSLWADPGKEIKAALKHVTVYPDRARFLHETTVEIPSGITILKLMDLSPYIDARSIQVKGYGDFMILSVNHQNNYLQNLEELPEIKSIRSQVETLQLKVEDEKAAINVLKEKEAFLVANRSILVKETTFTLEQLRSVMDLYTNNMEQVSMTILRKTRLIKDLEKQIAALQQQVAVKIGKEQLPSGEISVSVSSGKQVQGTLSFSYVAENAGWYPSYDIRVEDITKPVNILYKANVFQNTGVNWKDVKLSLSNATPWVSGNIPGISPWFIDYFQPHPKIAIRGYASQLSKSESRARDNEVDEIAPMMLAEAETAPVSVDKKVGETTITFDVAIPYTISPDNKVQTIEIQRSASPATYKYVAMPKISPLVYLTANITDWAKQSLLSGEATLYYENTFVGNSTLDVNQLSDTLLISLGTDNSILVKREKRQDFTSRKVIGTNKTETYSFLITIRNNKTVAARMTVNDQVPVSSNSAITVEPLELSDGKLDPVTGIVKWDLEVKPQETKKIILTYSVKYPKDKIVILE